MVEPTPLKNISQNGNLPHVGVKIEKYLKPPPSFSWPKNKNLAISDVLSFWLSLGHLNDERVVVRAFGRWWSTGHPNHHHHLIRWARIPRFSGLCGFVLPSWRSTARPPLKSYRIPNRKGSSSNHHFFRGYGKRWGWKQKRSTTATVCTNWKHDTHAIVYNGLSTRICSELQHVGHDIFKGNFSRSGILVQQPNKWNVWKQTCTIVYLSAYIINIYIYNIYITLAWHTKDIKLIWIMNWDITDFHVFPPKR